MANSKAGTALNPCVRVHYQAGSQPRTTSLLHRLFNAHFLPYQSVDSQVVVDSLGRTVTRL
jgi:hypothetical protein